LSHINLFLLHFAFFFAAHRFFAAKLILRFAAADTIRFFGLPTSPMNNFIRTFGAVRSRTPLVGQGLHLLPLLRDPLSLLFLQHRHRAVVSRHVYGYLALLIQFFYLLSEKLTAGFF
jgi:hypothetical protein